MADMATPESGDDLRPILNEYGNADWSGTVYPTHATELARQAGEQGYDMIIAMGGDARSMKFVNGIMQLPENQRPILGIYRLGSGNDFAHAIGIPMESDHALDSCAQGRAFQH